ncbi:hypothetical protein A4A49_23409 [Nicotiana attenuata]|uniref:Uncharacterized protein n=1 Tax=Nicotiana attenuata TaxID=49451 RepID=A0A314KPV8_NICAT|nr:hypothetical protein A4A49_23409 [Nicotiana attenuata]
MRTRKTNIPASSIRLNEERQVLNNLMEEHQLPMPQHQRVGAHLQSDSTTPTTQSVEQEVQLDANAPTVDEQGSCTKKRKRGKTRMLNVHGRSERKLIVVNEFDQPVGPTKDVVMKFGSFLGTLARNSTFCPLDIFDWRKINTKEDLWEYTKEKYNISEIAKKWTLDAIQGAWRRYKSQLKKDHFKAYQNDEIRMEKKPENIPAYQFKELLKYWNSDKHKEKEKETSDPLSLKDIFVATRQRKPGRTYKESNEDTTRKIAEMESIETQQSENGDESINAFASIMGPEHPGRLRLYGRGMEERMIRLEEKIEEQKEQYEEQKTMMRQEIVEDIIAKLQRSGLPIDANILATLYSRPLGQASSTQAAAFHLIHRPSLGSNNQG